MFYHILYPLKDKLSGLNIFQYITFRAAGAAITALIISFIVGPWIIRKLQSSQVLETISERGPKTHITKKGTPTMGGIIILAAVIPPPSFGPICKTVISISFCWPLSGWASLDFSTIT